MPGPILLPVRDWQRSTDPVGMALQTRDTLLAELVALAQRTRPHVGQGVGGPSAEQFARTFADAVISGHHGGDWHALSAVWDIRAAAQTAPDREAFVRAVISGVARFVADAVDRAKVFAPPCVDLDAIKQAEAEANARINVLRWQGLRLPELVAGDAHEEYAGVLERHERLKERIRAVHDALESGAALPGNEDPIDAVGRLSEGVDRDTDWTIGVHKTLAHGQLSGRQLEAAHRQHLARFAEAQAKAAQRIAELEQETEAARLELATQTAKLAAGITGLQADAATVEQARAQAVLEIFKLKTELAAADVSIAGQQAETQRVEQALATCAKEAADARAALEAQITSLRTDKLQTEHALDGARLEVAALTAEAGTARADLVAQKAASDAVIATTQQELAAAALEATGLRRDLLTQKAAHDVERGARQAAEQARADAVMEVAGLKSEIARLQQEAVDTSARHAHDLATQKTACDTEIARLQGEVANARAEQTAVATQLKAEVEARQLALNQQQADLQRQHEEDLRRQETELFKDPKKVAQSEGFKAVRDRVEKIHAAFIDQKLDGEDRVSALKRLAAAMDPDKFTLPLNWDRTGICSDEFVEERTQLSYEQMLVMTSIERRHSLFDRLFSACRAFTRGEPLNDRHSDPAFELIRIGNVILHHTGGAAVIDWDNMKIASDGFNIQNHQTRDINVPYDRLVGAYDAIRAIANRIKLIIQAIETNKFLPDGTTPLEALNNLVALAPVLQESKKAQEYVFYQTCWEGYHADLMKYVRAWNRATARDKPFLNM